MMRRLGSLVGAISLSMVLAPRRASADVMVYPRQGQSADARITPQGPGVVVMGGNYDVDDAFVWARDTVAGSAGTNGGDVVILRDPDPTAGQDDAYPAYLLKLASFNSAQTVVLSNTISAADVARAVALVDAAEVVFFGGGDQRDYVGWKGPLLDAVQRVYDRGGVVGGTSAGSALWGAYVNDAIGEYHHGSTLSAGAIANPYEASITFTNHLFAIPALSKVITDSHFRTRDRFGRLAAFTARLVADGDAPGYALGVGVDEDSALVIDRNGKGTLKLYTPGTGGAWIVRGGPATTIAQGKPLVDTVAVTRLDTDGQWFDFTRECSNGAHYPVAINGNSSSAYTPASPYDGSGAAVACAAASGDAGGGAGGDAGGGASSAFDGGGGTAPQPSADGGTAGFPQAPGDAGTLSATPPEFFPATAAGCACTTTRVLRRTDDASALTLFGLGLIASGGRCKRPRRR